MEFTEIHELPIDSRIVKQSAQATIRNLIDAVVELVTNSDDSYRRLEERGNEQSGKIEVTVSREKGGRCQIFIVNDYAEGMTREQLQKAVRFGGQTSGFEEGRAVRGLFGRGLKESVISLGEGQIHTIRNNILNAAKIWWDEKDNKAKYALTDEIQNPSSEQRGMIKEGNGTSVTTLVKNEKIRIPEYNKFKQQISDHYALREITSSDKRKIGLIFLDRRRSMVTKQENIEFEPPNGAQVYQSEVNLPVYGDALAVEVFESPIQLNSPRLNPFGRAGILIKSGAAILDSSLFKYENEPAALYFWGEARCDGIAAKVRSGEIGIIDFNRAGIDWRHEYCQRLQGAVEQILAPLIQKKKRELEEKAAQREVAKPTKDMLKKLCDVLNELANEEFKEWEPDVEPTERITSLTILPRYANIQVDKPRLLTVYAPAELVQQSGNRPTLNSDNINVSILSSQVSLNRKHPKYHNLYYGVFNVVGLLIGEEANIHGELGSQKALTHVKVAEEGKKRKGKKPTGRRHGFISAILPDEITNPIQRVEYVDNTGEIKIKIKFPGVARYLGSGLVGIETDQGKVFLAELVGEAFCKKLATEKLERGESSPFPGAEIDFFNSTVNILQKKYLDKIHEVIAGWEFNRGD